jgi:hypothetical protein
LENVVIAGVLVGLLFGAALFAFACYIVRWFA